VSDVAIDGLRIVGASYSTELAQAITSSALARTVDGGSTLDVEVADYRRLLVTSQSLAGKAYADVSGLHFELVAVKKAANRVTLTFEDAVVVELKRSRGPLVIPASSTTRAEIAQRLCAEAGVQVSVDPEARGVYNTELKRDDQGNSWEKLQTLASDIGWRCFSDGRQLLFGSDAWLATLSQPLELKEGVDPVLSDIDYSMDVAKPASAASFDVASERWALPPGRTVRLSSLGWADGDWLVSSFSRSLTSNRGRVDLVRRQLVLAEPAPEAAGDQGEEGYLPEGGDDISADLARLRQCEASGDYKKNSGNGYYGAYQFDLRTWQQDLGYSGRPDQADPATQDEAAKKLYQKRGWKPWPACSTKLGLVDRRSSGKVIGAATTTGNAARDRMIAWAMSKRGHAYVWGGQYDCSAFVRAATKDAGKELAGTSKGQYATCKAQGKLISVQEGLRTRGAILFRMSGEPTHVAISLGDDSTIEARGKAYGCNVFTGASKRTWTHAATWL